jgi:hypothetical protein
MCVCVCVYVCMYVWYVCMYVCMYVCLYVCMYVCMYVCINIVTVFNPSILQVQYVNDGSDHLEDLIVFELEFSTAFALPQHLKMRHRFTLHIGVRPKNDLPVIELRRGALLRLAKGTKKLLPSNLFDVKDPDDEPGEIAITLVSMS